MENVRHYNVEKLSPELQAAVANNKLTGPCFIGQGLNKYSGSDCYGYYIVAEKKLKTKHIWGIASALTRFHGAWQDGDMDCSIDIDHAIPDQWITSYGKHWYFCDKNGNRFIGLKCQFGWNGAYAYRDPNV